MRELITLKTLEMFAAVGDACNPSSGGFFGFPTWYKYINGQREEGGTCGAKLEGVGDVWLILLALIEILLRLAAIAATVFIIWGGIKLITARGDTGGSGRPDKIAAARTTIVDALIGLVIAIIAVALVSFVARRLS